MSEGKFIKCWYCGKIEYQLPEQIDVDLCTKCAGKYAEEMEEVTEDE